MAFTQLIDDLAIIQKLDDEPNDVGGLTAAELKAKFDEGVLAIQDYINTVLLAELASTAAPTNIGASIEEFPAVSTLQDALDKILEVAKNAQLGEILPGSIVTAMLANLAVTEAKIADDAVTEDKIADGSITAAKLAGAIIGTNNVSNGAVTGDKLAAAAATTAKIADKAITTAKLADYAVTALQIAAAAISTAKLADLAVTTAKLADGGVTNGKIADATIQRGKLAANAVSNVYSATIPGSGWSGSGPYTQTISVNGLTADDRPIIDIVPSDTYADAQAQMDAWAEIYKMVAGNGTLTVYANSATETDVDIQILCVRK